MPISVDNFRNVNPNLGNLEVSQDGTNIQKAGSFQWLKSVFGSKEARSANEAVINLLADTIRNDPRYQSIRSSVEAEISNLKSDRPITSKMVRQIIDNLDKLSTPEQMKAAFASKLMSHDVLTPPSCLAAFPELKEGYQKAFSCHINDIMENTTDFNSLDPAQIKADFDAKLQENIDIINDADLPIKDTENILKKLFSADNSSKMFDSANLSKIVNIFTKLNTDELSERHDKMIKEIVFSSKLYLDDVKFNQFEASRIKVNQADKVLDEITTKTLPDMLKAAGCDIGQQGIDNMLSKIKEKFNFATNEQIFSKEYTDGIVNNLVNQYKSAMEVAQQGTSNNVGMSIVKSVPGVVTPSYIQNIFQAAGSLDPTLITNFSSTKTQAELLKDLFKLNSAINKKLDGFENKPEGLDGLLHASRSIVALMTSKMSAEELKGVKETLACPQIQTMYAFLATNTSYAEGPSGMLALNSLLYLDRAVNEQQGAPSAFPDPQAFNISSLDLEVRELFPRYGLLSGNFTLPGLTKSSLDGFPVIQQSYKEKMKESFASVQTSLQMGLEKIKDNEVNQNPKTYKVSVFEKDISRGLNIILPDGTKLPNNFTGAKNTIARFISNGAVTNFDSLAQTDKHKAYILMSFMSQETQRDTIRSVYNALIPGFEEHYAFFDNPNPAEINQYNITTTPDGGIGIQYERKSPVGMFITDGKPTQAREDSYVHARSSFVISGAELERLANADWSALNGIEANSVANGGVITLVDEFICNMAELDLAGDIVINV